MPHPAISCALTHIVSQLAFRWIAPPCQTTIADTPIALETLTRADWRAFCETPATQPQGDAWRDAFYRKLGGDARLVAGVAWEHMSALHAAGGHYLTIADSSYPASLRSLSDPPTAVSILGEPSLFARPTVAMVGSRKASGFAVMESEKLGTWLADRGWVVVSGGAYGCDVAAHRGALNSSLAPAPTVVVFAGGLKQWYPTGNLGVFREIARRRGVLLSERLWWAASRPYDFPVRNRLIAGLSGKVLIMQAATVSGAMVTARLALDQGRDVAILRHPTGDVRAEGSAALEADGAEIFLSAEDYVLRVLGDP